MPKRSLELLDRVGPLFDPNNNDVHKLNALLQSVRPVPLSELILCYSTQWWQSLGLQRGRSITDLPIRQVYYWASEAKGNSALVIYNDADNVDYWGGMRLGDSRLYAARVPVGGASAGDSEVWNKYIAPEDMCFGSPCFFHSPWCGEFCPGSVAFCPSILKRFGGRAQIIGHLWACMLRLPIRSRTRSSTGRSSRRRVPTLGGCPSESLHTNRGGGRTSKLADVHLHEEVPIVWESYLDHRCRLLIR